MAADRLRFLDAGRLRELMPWPVAVAAIEGAVSGHGSSAFPRTVVDTQGGQLLLMPAETGDHVGVKIATVAPGNPRLGLPRIQGLYLLIDAATLTPVLLVDAAELTTIRTAAVSATAISHLAAEGAEHLVVFGTGPQGWAHVRAIAAVRPVRRISVIGRDPQRLQAFVRRCVEQGLPAEAATARVCRQADVVVCATSAREPLFDSALLAEDATVVAVGSHEPTAREVDTALVCSATVVVETRQSALREAGDLLIPISEGAFAPGSIAGDLAELVAGQLRVEPGRRRLFKSVGEGWQDLTIAAASYQQWAEQSPGDI